MEILVAVIAFAGALLAGIATGALVTRLREEPEGWLIAWTVAAPALCLALGVAGFGHLMGFGALTFKLVQIAGSLLAPLWLAIGLIQLLSEKVPPKFLGWLFGIAYTIVATVIMLVDPLVSEEMGKSLPPASAHWALIPSSLLTGVHAIAGLIMLVAVVVAALRWRNGDEYDTDNLHATLVIAPSGLALMGAMQFKVPAVFTVVLLIVAAAAIWYAVLRPLAPYEDDDEDEPVPAASRREERAAGRRDDRPVAGHRQEPVGHREAPEPIAEPARPRKSGLGDLVAEYRANDEVDYAARMSPPPDAGPSTGYIMNGERPDYGMPVTGERPDLSMPSTGSMPATGAVYPGAELFSPRGRRQAAQPGPQPTPHSAPQAAVGSAKLSPNIYGMLTVFTLMDGSGAAFDRLAEQTVEAVRRGEPDTLVYACHAVKSAPLQRIVYELYRDEVAYRDHQRQPHVERFISDRQSMVLATNIIELNVQAAKVVPLPTAMF
ncbi:putative quinol monooxygenase [Nonomuraea sp. SBT364]|uniref:putative quinol monooxygenase n=1 Tax=Nonomuraea sp. SBT364 TaxID=1580530 RepID=UPI00066C216F|nr:antibiotic biosynthesis monooxygenase [Nonomuraea sp. SBT364]